MNAPCRTAWVAGRGPISLDRARCHSVRDIRLQGGSVPEDAGSAGVADRWMRPVDLLRHGADQAGELGKIAFEDRLAELDVPEQTVKGVIMLVVWRVLEKG
jgi:hypothetical protein